MKKAIALPFLLLILMAAVTLSGCAGMSDTQTRTLSGTAIGAAGGALISGGSAKGTLLGAGVGALGSYAYDQHKKVRGQ